MCCLSSTTVACSNTSSTSFLKTKTALIVQSSGCRRIAHRSPEACRRTFRVPEQDSVEEDSAELDSQEFACGGAEGDCDCADSEEYSPAQITNVRREQNPRGLIQQARNIPSWHTPVEAAILSVAATSLLSYAICRRAQPWWDGIPARIDCAVRPRSLSPHPPGRWDCRW